MGGGRSIYVEARELDRARTGLAEAENVDEDELERLSQEAVKRPAGSS